MTEPDGGAFDLDAFLPYLLNQAGEATSRSFAEVYQAEYGITQTQWRVLAKLGRSGPLTATAICRLSFLEKTKVSRAVAALDAQGLVARERHGADRRAEVLALTRDGQAAFERLGALAQEHDRALRERLGPEAVTLVRVLRGLIAAGVPEAGMPAQSESMSTHTSPAWPSP